MGGAYRVTLSTFEHLILQLCFASAFGKPPKSCHFLNHRLIGRSCFFKSLYRQTRGKENGSLNIFF